MRTTTATINVAGTAVPVRTALVRDQPFTFFPSVGEYPVYDDVIYDGFGADDARRRAYRAAIRASARGRVVLDIGTGRDALWAVEAARAGARHAYAVEAQPAATAQARRTIARAGVASQVTVIEGRSEQITVPQSAQVCVGDRRQHRLRGRHYCGHRRRSAAPVRWCRG